VGHNLPALAGETPASQVASGEPYRLESNELPFYLEFRKRLDAALQKLGRLPKLDLAITYFNKSFGDLHEADQLIDLLMCLEALLLQEDQELSFRLALRAANLLGASPDDRRAVYRQVKEYYDVRCKVVHGDFLKPRHDEVLHQVSRLRELVRRVLLSSVAVAESERFDEKFYARLDEAALDDDVRKDLQTKASSLLYLR